MKWLILLSVFLTPLLAKEACPLLVEVKAGGLIFSSPYMQKIYGNGTFQIQASSSYPLKQNLDIYGSIGFAKASGGSAYFNQKTTFWKIPVDLGFKPIVDLHSRIQWYTAFGPRYFYAHQHNQSSFVNKNIGRSGLGVFVNTGFNFFLSQHLLIDIFGEYSYEPLHFLSSKAGVQARNIQIGGFYLGAGFGYDF